MAACRDFWLEGLIPAVFTPFDENGELDINKIGEYCEYLIRNEIKAVFVNGGSGEGNSLTGEERKKVAEKWMEVAKGRLKIVIHIGASNIRDSQALARHASDIGVDAIASLPSLFFKPRSVESLVEHCKSIADVAPELPFYYYHIPPRSGVEINMEDFLIKAKEKIPNLVGIKYSSNDLIDMLGCVYVGGAKYNILYGCDPQLIAGITTGAHGAIGTFYNCLPKLYKRLLDFVKKGDMENARMEQLRTQVICRVFGKYGKLLGDTLPAVKALMPLVGMDLGPCRQPMRSMTKDELVKYQQDIEETGFYNWDATIFIRK